MPTTDELQSSLDALDERVTNLELLVDNLFDWRATIVTPMLFDHERRLALLENWRETQVDPTLVDYGQRIKNKEEKSLAVNDTVVSLLDVLLGESGALSWEQYHRVLLGDSEDTRLFTLKNESEIGPLPVSKTAKGTEISDRPT